MPELIDRISLIDKLDQGQKNALDAKDFMSFYALVFFKVILQEAPTIEAEPVRHGRWIKEASDMYICSECGVPTYLICSEEECSYDYCPNCGAKMQIKKRAPLCKECRWFTPIAFDKKNGFCHKGEIRERIVRAYDGQPKKCRRENENA